MPQSYSNKDDAINFSYNSDQLYQPQMIKDPSVQHLNGLEFMQGNNQITNILNQQQPGVSRSITNTLSYSSLPQSGKSPSNSLTVKQN